MSVQEMDKSDLTISLKDKLSEGIREFSEKIIDLNFGFPLAMGWASLSSILHSTETLSFIEEFGNVNGKEFTLPLECVNQFSKLSRRDSAADMYFKRMPGFYLTALVEELDLYIGNLVGILLDHEGFEQRLSDKHISYKEMLSFSSFEKARKSLIDKEIDNVLRQGIASQIDWFNGAGYKLPIDHFIIKQQIEIGERRNCIVHADGKANSTYIEKCDKHEISISPKKEGDSLKPDGKYCNQSFEATLIFGDLYTCVTQSVQRIPDRKDDWQKCRNGSCRKPCPFASMSQSDCDQRRQHHCDVA